MTAHLNIPQHSHDASEKPTQPDSIVGSYLICEKIGQGSFATVYKAQHKVSGHLVAIKSVLRSKLTKKLLENLESEISILKAIQHDHIVGLSECQRTHTHIHLVMDYCTMGDLSQYIKRIRSTRATRGPLGGLPEITLRHFLCQLASALQFLRSQNLVHRDIKPQNLLLISPPKDDRQSSSSSQLDLPILQVADFGFARFLPNASMADTLCGSPLYMGPEILSYKKYDAKADLWSVGAVLYEMVTGRPPFHAQNHLELLKIIQENNDVIRFPDEKTIDGWSSSSLVGDDLKDLIRKLLKMDPVGRLSFEGFFTHPAISLSAKTLISHTPIPRHAEGSSHSATSTATPSYISGKHQHDPVACYEVPPFAQSLSSPYQDPHQKTPVSSSPTRQIQKGCHRYSNGNDASPTQSSQKSRKTVDFNDLHESQWLIEPKSPKSEDEDVLQEYVVLDRRIIATNEFADEIKNSPHNNNKDQYPTRTQPIDQVTVSRRKSSSSLSSTASSISNQTDYASSPNTPPFSASREKEMSGGMAGFTKALSVATERLFGTGHSLPPLPINNSNNSNNKLQQTMMVGLPRGFMGSQLATYNGNSSFPEDPDQRHSYNAVHYDDDNDNDEDKKAMELIEKASCMGHAVAKFADSKFDLLIRGDRGNVGGIMGMTQEPIMLAAEALILHLKVLELLEFGLEKAKIYWHRRRREYSSSSDTRQQQQQGQRHDRQQQHETPPPRTSATTTRLNEVVQWMRERFNECLDKASIEKSRCDNSSVHSSIGCSSFGGNNPCVEKLLYDRALEMSRAAAVHELVGENLIECEQDYQTAIWMLEAILEVGDNKDVSIEEGDCKIINKFIDSIQKRISALREKL